jgi:polyether ionophore transport system permease protein
MSADLVLARQLFRLRAKAALVWAAAFATVVYTSSASYLTAYPDPAQRLALARSLQSNVGVAALFGRIRAVDTVGGFAAWRSLGVLMVVGGCWGVLTGARLLRGEEDAGRWELLLAGRISRRRAAFAGLLAAGGLVLVLFAVTCVGALLGAWATGLPIRSGLFLALVLVLPAALFLLIGAGCGQLTGSRRSAARLAGVLLGAAYLIRLVAIASGRSWLEPLSPLSWIDASHPMTGSDLWPLLPLGLLGAGVGLAIVLVAGRRDLGAGVLAVNRRPNRSTGRLLSGPTALAARQALPALVGWFVAAATMCLVVGLVAESVGDQAAQSAWVQQLTTRMGATHAGAVAFLALSMTVLSTLIALAAAGLAAGLREDEEAGLVQHLLVRPVSRLRWLAGRATVATAVLLLLGAGAGGVLALALLGRPGFGSAALFDSGLNVVPPAVLVFGAAVLCFGIVPHWTAVVGYALVGWSFLVELVGAAVAAPTWVLDLSLLHHVALAPATAPDWRSNGVLVGLGVLAAVLGGWRFRVRDLAG